MDSELETTATKTKVMTYEEANQQLEEVGKLLKSRKPVKVKVENMEIDDLEIPALFFAFIGTFTSAGAGIAIGIPALSLLPLIPIGWVIGRTYNGNPKNKIGKFFFKVFRTKNQQQRQTTYHRVMSEEKTQRKIFELLIQAKREELQNQGVFEALHSGVRRHYPWIDNSGEIQKLSQEQWIEKNGNSELENTKRTAETLKELISKNSELAKAITT